MKKVVNVFDIIPDFDLDNYSIKEVYSITAKRLRRKRENIIVYMVAK